MNVFDLYARNLTQKTKVGNSDEKADNYWYWFLSVVTAHDLTHYFNDDYSWAYGVSNNFHGTNYVPGLNLPSWMPQNSSHTSSTGTGAQAGTENRSITANGKTTNVDTRGDPAVKPCAAPVPAAPNCAAAARSLTTMPPSQHTKEQV